MLIGGQSEETCSVSRCVLVPVVIIIGSGLCCSVAAGVVDQWHLTYESVSQAGTQSTLTSQVTAFDPGTGAIASG